MDEPPRPAGRPRGPAAHNVGDNDLDAIEQQVDRLDDDLGKLQRAADPLVGNAADPVLRPTPPPIPPPTPPARRSVVPQPLPWQTSVLVVVACLLVVGAVWLVTLL